MNDTSTDQRIKLPIALVIAWALLLEFPIRYFVSPDPWINASDHWYFEQPSRLLIELAFVALALFPFFVINELKELLNMKWNASNRMFLLFGILGSALIFGLQQVEEVNVILQDELVRYIPIWFFTGIAVGVGQELTFRGLIFSGLYKWFGVKSAVVISTLLFVIGSIHSVRLYTYFTNDYLFETLLLVGIYISAGLFFVWVRIQTKNILIPALIHGIGNAVTWSTFVVVKLYA